MVHDCRSRLCETPHYDEHPESCSCETCHVYHQESGIENFQGSSCCADQVAYDQEVGVRCTHGELVPYVTDPRAKFPGILTDMECVAGCQVDFGVALGWDARAGAA